MKRLKPLMPSLRERKRYLAYEIISEHQITDFNDVSDEFWRQISNTLGQLGAAKAGIRLLDDTYDSEIQRGLIRVSHTDVDELRFALMNVTSINDTKALVRSVGVSGIIKKAKEKFMEG